MKYDDMLNKMVSPGMRRKGKPLDGVLQIHVTRACDLSCFNCTQGSNLRGKTAFISLENFELACQSLESYFGVVGLIGGNPCLHPEFEELCNILRKYIPFERRGLWSNHPRGNGKICRETFNPRVSNLNTHMVQKAYVEFKKYWPESNPFGVDQNSRHSPVHLAMKDVVKKKCPACEGDDWTQCRSCNGEGKIPDVDRCNEVISRCDVNQHWSAMMIEINGELYGYFCEIAAAQALLHSSDSSWPITGISVRDNLYWWNLTMSDFKDQVNQHCYNCGVPLKGYGSLAHGEDGIEYTSKTHEDIYNPKKKDRVVQIVEDVSELNSKDLEFTKYLQGADK